MPNHTPGPWENVGESGNDAEAYVIEGPERTIAWTCDTYDEDKEAGTVTDVDMANANLICAAPDLLEACEQVLSASEDGGDMDDIDWDGLRKAVLLAREGRNG